MKSKLWITLGFFLMAGAGVFGAFFYTKYYFQSPKAGTNLIYPVFARDIISLLENKSNSFKGLNNQPYLHSSISQQNKINNKAYNKINNKKLTPGQQSPNLSDSLRSQEKIARIFHFWASWCEPCLLELPEVIKYATKVNNKKPSVEIYLVSLDYEYSDLERTLKIFPELAQHNIQFIWDYQNIVSKHFSIEKLPITFVSYDLLEKFVIYEGIAPWDQIFNSVYKQN